MKVKKIGIISELNLNNVNYGNRLQAFALNKYLNSMGKYKVESVLLKKHDEKIFTKKIITTRLKIWLLSIKQKIFTNKLEKYFASRLENCNNFTKNNTILSSKEYTRKMLEESDYDIFIVGSDVVWAQKNNSVNRIRFLDIKKRNVKKISYAASFGQDWIPEENKKVIKEKLNSFDAISVREKSSIELLENIGIKHIVHTCDPTLLIDKTEWKKLSKKPQDFQLCDKYIFVYLLGKDKNQRDEIKRIAKQENLKIVNIPHANGIISDVDYDFSDVNIDDCSPENWIWLIENCEYFFTDSFHGSIFATIFEKKFLILTREGKQNINNRMIDYMDTIDSKDKFVNIKNITDIKNIKWDYSIIKIKIENLKKESKKFLTNTLN